MTAQDLSPKELKTCAILYSTANSILFTNDALYSIDNKCFYWLNADSINNRVENPIIIGKWFDRPFCSMSFKPLQSLILKGLLIPQEEHKQKFYVLNICEEFKEFFKELKVQIALGSI